MYADSQHIKISYLLRNVARMLAEQRFLKRRSEDATPNKEAESLQSIAQGKALWNY